MERWSLPVLRICVQERYHSSAAMSEDGEGSGVFVRTAQWSSSTSPTGGMGSASTIVARLRWHVPEPGVPGQNARAMECMVQRSTATYSFSLRPCHTKHTESAAVSQPVQIRPWQPLLCLYRSRITTPTRRNSSSNLLKEWATCLVSEQTVSLSSP